MLESDLPDPRQEEAFDDDDESEGGEHPSLTDDIVALIDDGKTYVEAEVAFQKSRASFAIGKGSKAALFGIFALGFVHLALVGLVVGAVITLSPHITPAGATVAVVVALLIGAFVLLQLARKHMGEAKAPFEDDQR